MLIRKRSNPIKKSRRIKTSLHKRIKSIGVILIILIIISSVFYILINLDDVDQSNSEDFIFTSLDGNKIHLNSYRGKIVILDLWATWCSPCRTQMIELKQIFDKYSRDELEILSIDVDTSETFQQIQDFRDSFMDQEGIKLNWIFGKDDGSIWQKYKMSKGGIPTLCVFDQEGILYFQGEGVKDSETLTQKIDDLLRIK